VPVRHDAAALPGEDEKEETTDYADFLINKSFCGCFTGPDATRGSFLEKSPPWPPEAKYFHASQEYENTVKIKKMVPLY